MKNHYKLNVQDELQLLSDLDLHQIENLVWLRLASVRDSVSAVNFEFSQNSTEKAASPKYVARISTELTSGKVVHTQVHCGNKLETLLSVADLLGEKVGRRVKREAQFPLKNWRFLTECFAPQIVHLKRRMVTGLLAITEPAFRLYESQMSHKLQKPRV
jgi:hypothetical protein